MRKRKRPRLWKPRLRPIARRRLPPELRPDRVREIAVRLDGGVRDPAFPTLLSRIDQTAVLGGNCVDVYFDGAAAFDAMTRDVDAATTEVLVESYIWKDDATGHRALDALGRAAARGVAVRALADAVGSLSPRKAYWEEMRRRPGRCQTELHHRRPARQRSFDARARAPREEQRRERQCHEHDPDRDPLRRNLRRQP